MKNPGRLFGLTSIALVIALSCAWFPGAAGQTLEKVISREDKRMDVTGKHLAVGRDGHVFVINNQYVIRYNKDGSGKQGFRPSYAVWNVATDAKGEIAVACGHMDSSVHYLSPQLEERFVAGRGEFLDNDKVGWFAPCDIWSGPSGDVYAPDTHRARVIRLGPDGKKVAEYSFKDCGENYNYMAVRLRVAEPLQRFYISGQTGNIYAIGFDNKLLWTLKAELGGQGQSWKDWAGDFDVDDQGNLYILRNMSDTIEVYDKDGKPSGKIKLDMGDLKGERLTVRLTADDVFIKRAHPTEMFQVYDRKSGKLRRVVQADVETVHLDYGSNIWTVGQAQPLTTTVSTPTKTRTMSWPVQIARYNDSAWQTLPVVDGKVTPPAGAGGLYHIRVGYAEYALEMVVEIRQPNSKGTLSILTPLNRVYYGRGEEIPVTAILRGGQATDAAKVSLVLHDEATNTDVMQLGSADLTWKATTASAKITAARTSQLRPGRYLLTAKIDGLTVAPQVLVIGHGLRERPVFNIIQSSDSTPPATFFCGLFDGPSEVARLAARWQRIGMNMFMDRVGTIDFINSPAGTEPIVARLKANPVGVAPEKAEIENINRQAVAARGANGMEEQAVLLAMDTSIPCLNEGEDNPGGWLPYGTLSGWQTMMKDRAKVLAPYVAYRGWTWAYNWWIQQDLAFRHAGIKVKERNALYHKILDTGVWDDKFIPMSDVLFKVTADVDKGLTTAMNEVLPGKAHAVTGPWRQPGVYPPVSMGTASEVDLFCQAEQLPMPLMATHNVDFYKRPGKRAFGHSETFNEDGSGGMIGALLMGQAARGAEGTGWEGEAPAWVHFRLGGAYGVTNGNSEDPRSTWQGHVSTYQSLISILKHYGPWLTTLQSSDRVAIIVSNRMMRLNDYLDGGNLGGKYFERLFEAYNVCLYAHMPASFVFTEDLTPQTLKQYKALLIVNQRVELEPAMAKAIAEAQAAGVNVFYDGTCRAEHVKNLKPLGIDFDSAEKMPCSFNVDYLYLSMPRFMKQKAKKIAEVLGSTVAPVAEVANPGIMLTERRNGEGRFVWAVNNDLPDWEPWLIWRLATYVSTRVPQLVPITLDAKDKTVYELFAMKQVQAQTTADLQAMPARLFAILPRPIEGLTLKADDKARAGADLAWEVSVKGPQMTYPLHLRLLDASGNVLEESFPVKTSGTFTVPVNAGTGLTLEAIELISGKSDRQQIQVIGSLVDKAPAAGPADVRPLEQPVEARYGSHLRDIAVTADGASAIINSMNWTDNYYIVDTANGSVRQKGAVGHHYAYGPQTGGNQLYVQGYDVLTPEGYHLYEISPNGQPARRIANFGLSQRMVLYFGHVLVDRINNFIVAPAGQWIANAGNLGLAVWSKDGKLLWSQEWWKTTRKQMLLVAQGDQTLLTLCDMTVTAYEATTGKERWHLTLGEIGRLQGGTASADGRTVACWSDTIGGRVFVLRDGKLVNTIFALPDNLHLTLDGKRLLMNLRRELRCYEADGAALWSFNADDWMHNVRLSPDGKKIAFGTDIGTLYVLDLDGKVTMQRDFGASPVCRWIGDDLLVATWQGDVVRLSADGKQKWATHLQAGGPSRLQSAPVAETLATLAVNWRKETALPAPSLTDNLLTQAKATVHLTDDRVPIYVHPIDFSGLTDGKTQPPDKPWLSWVTVGAAENGWGGKIVLTVESPVPMSVSGMTFVEDPQHPESWLRNMDVDVWDPAKGRWVPCPPLLSDAAVHTHRFETPIVGTKFRIYGDRWMSHEPGFERPGVGGIGWPVGNLRLGELIFHGKVLDVPKKPETQSK